MIQQEFYQELNSVSSSSLTNPTLDDTAQLRKDAESLYVQLTNSIGWPVLYYLVCCVVLIPLLPTVGYLALKTIGQEFLGAVIGFGVSIPLSAIIAGKIMRKRQIKVVWKYITMHKNDKLVPYLIEIVNEMDNEINPYVGDVRTK